MHLLSSHNLESSKKLGLNIANPELLLVCSYYNPCDKLSFPYKFCKSSGIFSYLIDSCFIIS